MSVSAHGLLAHGTSGLRIDIECHLSNNLPTIIISGLAGKTVTESKDRLRGAFASSQLELPRRRITLNLAPADIPKADSGLDLALAVSILVTSGQVMSLADNQAVIGELGLDGSVRPVRGIIGKLTAARAQGLISHYIPAANLEQAQLVPGLQLYPIDNLRQLYDHLAGKRPVMAVTTGDGIYMPATRHRAHGPLMEDVVGQEYAKRVLTIAAAGGHNVLLSGPPGTGKSMLAKALPSLLPPLGHEEMLEVTQLHSLASNNYEQLLTERPIRSPHHTISHIAMVGGGTTLRPGEISLSHRGILFLDEFPEFSRQTIEALRQPLEDRVMSVARLKDSIQFPANFILVATTNPCPCGYYGSRTRSCSCPAWHRQRYQSHLSGPIIDRIDLCSDVEEVAHERLLQRSAPPAAGDTDLRRLVATARARQAARYLSPTKLNSDLTSRELRQAIRMDHKASALLAAAANSLRLSTRAYLRTLKVALTIADLDGQDTISSRHISEAVRYRHPGPAGSPLISGTTSVKLPTLATKESRNR